MMLLLSDIQHFILYLGSPRYLYVIFMYMKNFIMLCLLVSNNEIDDKMTNSSSKKVYSFGISFYF